MESGIDPSHACWVLRLYFGSLSNFHEMFIAIELIRDHLFKFICTILLICSCLVTREDSIWCEFVFLKKSHQIYNLFFNLQTLSKDLRTVID